MLHCTNLWCVLETKRPFVSVVKECLIDLCSPVWFLRSRRYRKHNVLTAGVRPSCSPHQGMSSYYRHPVLTEITAVFFQPWSSTHTVLHVWNVSPDSDGCSSAKSLFISHQLKSSVLKLGNLKLSGQCDQSWKTWTTRWKESLVWGTCKY